MEATAVSVQNFGASMNIHNIKSIQVGNFHELSSGTHVCDIFITTHEGLVMNINCFAEDADSLKVKKIKDV